MKDELAVLKPQYEIQKQYLQRLMEEEKALLKEMHDLQEKALLRNGKVVSSSEHVFLYLSQKNIKILIGRYIVSLIYMKALSLYS